MSYKFDGKNLKFNGTTIANVQNNSIRKGSGSTTVANIKDDNVRQGSGSTTLINVKGQDIRLATGSTRIATMKDVDNDIDGPGGITKAALWFLFVK
jgi:hypothetical protein